MNHHKNSKVLAIFCTTLLLVFSCVSLILADQNPIYPAPTRCAGADWNVGLPSNVVCLGSVTTGGDGDAMENDPSVQLIIGESRLLPDLSTLNKFCQEYTGQANSYATYGRMHNFCNGCDQSISWWQNNQWNSQQVCYGTLNVQKVTCATGCSAVVCNSNSDCDDSNPNTEDVCISPGTGNSHCVHNNITCSLNSQCGIDGYVGNPTCQSGNVYQDYKQYTCVSPGTGSSHCSNSTVKKLVETCTNTCSNGACVQTVTCSLDSDCNDFNLYTYDRCNNPGTPSSYCSHTPVNCVTNNDCGFTGYFGTEFCSGNDVFKYFQNAACINPGTTQSFCNVSTTSNNIASCGSDSCDSFGNNYCKSGSVYHLRTCYNKGCSEAACISTQYNDEQIVQVCSNGCSSGVCNGNEQINCSSNSDCNDNNNHTLDICVNPGAANSFCVHNQINCSTNSDCGQDGFTGHKICQGNNVFGNFVTYTCESPGTAQSSCTNSTLVKQSQACSNPQICNNGDCEDNNGPIVCQGNSIVQRSITLDCNDPFFPGLCFNYTSLVIQQNCSNNQLCSGGQCINIICFSNSDCNDDNGLTIDVCNSPGTLDSSCSHNGDGCTTDSDCGSSSFILKCNGDSVEKVTTSPGCSQGTCHNNSAATILENCRYGCSNGECEGKSPHSSLNHTSDEDSSYIYKYDSLNYSYPVLGYNAPGTIDLSENLQTQEKNSPNYFLWIVLFLVLALVFLALLLINSLRSKR